VTLAFVVIDAGRESVIASKSRKRIVGWAETSFHDPTCAGPQGRNQVLQFQAVIWGPGGTIRQQLSPLGDDPDSAAVAINVWEDGTVTDLGSFGGVAWNTPVAINQKGQIAGFSDFPGDQDGRLTSHAFFWTKETGIQDVGILKGNSLSLGLGMNNRAQVVGESIGPNGPRAFLWQNGALLNLNSILPTGSSWSLLYAGDINDRGEITGGFVDRSSVECGPSTAGCAFLAIPTNDQRRFDH